MADFSKAAGLMFLGKNVMELMSIPANKICIDCGAHAPQVSPILISSGLLLVLVYSFVWNVQEFTGR
jgi:hypothetical protein